ncbi:MAG: DNA cytosine methyltransferase [Methanothrix sp.]|nr:MAG: DNA cytosine methyltransferase [Methanothrix sp.]
MIPNHYAARLSSLDRLIVQSVPPGGNWKAIPESIPSQRLKQIRISYAAGQGSRSTYYGRLHPNAPAYTINTYFTRPGNGCHIHYDERQHRTLSQREAARLQSFPDKFVFYGSKSNINKQIGNAVPPLVAYQIARIFPFKGQFVDLFSGAGGLSQGFLWAGWSPIIANDIEESFLATYRANIHESVIVGDIRDKSVFNIIIEKCKEARLLKPDIPLFVIGGPPCQGFSTAGNRRSMCDDRNWLFSQYKAMIEELMPDGFVFENVPGLMNMDGGRVFKMIYDELRPTVKHLITWKLQAEMYGVPQRRTRVILIGDLSGTIKNEPPIPVTQLSKQSKLCGNLHPAITVKEALSDLPPLEPEEDGSNKQYLHEPEHPYQAFMRSMIPADKYLKELAKSKNVDS